MNWDAIGAIGEIVGAFAVVITLGFLVTQLRQNTLAVRQQSERESTTAISEWHKQLMTPENAAAVGHAYTQTDSPLTPAEMIPVENAAMALLTVLQQDFLDWKRGLQSDEVWESRKPLIGGLMVPKPIQTWWQTIGHAYVVPEFRTLVEEIMATDSRQSEYWEPYRQALDNS
jgi:hypothetical protein